MSTICYGWAILLSHIQLYVNVCAAYILTYFFPGSDSHHSSTGGAAGTYGNLRVLCT